MNFVLDKLVNHAETNLELSKFEAAKLRFMFESIFMNVVEFIVIAIFFAFLGRFTGFLIAVAVLVSVRSFSGGFHLKKFRYCFVLTSAIFVLGVLILPDISSTGILIEVLLLASVVLTAILAPVSRRNSAHTSKNNLIIKVVSVAIVLAHCIWILIIRNDPYASIATWMIFIQGVQLVIGRVMLQREKAAIVN